MDASNHQSMFTNVTWNMGNTTWHKDRIKTKFKNFKKWKQAIYGWEQRAERPKGNDIKNSLHIKEISRNVTRTRMHLHTHLHTFLASKLPGSDLLPSEDLYHVVSIQGQSISAQTLPVIPFKLVTLIFGSTPFWTWPQQCLRGSWIWVICVSGYDCSSAEHNFLTMAVTVSRYCSLHALMLVVSTSKSCNMAVKIPSKGMLGYQPWTSIHSRRFPYWWKDFHFKYVEDFNNNVYIQLLFMVVKVTYLEYYPSIILLKLCIFHHR